MVSVALVEMVVVWFVTVVVAVSGRFVGGDWSRSLQAHVCFVWLGHLTHEVLRVINRGDKVSLGILSRRIFSN